MIKSFDDEVAEEVFEGIHTHAIRKKFTSEVVKAAERKLDLLHCVDSLETLAKIPGNQPDASVRDAHGKYSIPLVDGWRIAFRWNHNHAEDVEIKR